MLQVGSHMNDFRMSDIRRICLYVIPVFVQEIFSDRDIGCNYKKSGFRAESDVAGEGEVVMRTH
jgi:hypothetical protein